MSSLAVSASGGASASSPVAPFNAALEANHATVNNVAALLQQGRDGEATAILTQARQGQSQAMQDALDRMVSAKLRTSLDTPPSTPGLQGMYASPVEIGNTIRRINDAGNSRPAMPDTDGLTAEQKFDVYSSIVQTRGNQAARDALDRGDKVILGMRKEDNSVVNHGKGEYNDRIVVLSRDPRNGTVKVEEFDRASADPTAQYDANTQHKATNAKYDQKELKGMQFRRPEGEDVTGDRIPELGRLSEGTVEMWETTHPTPWAGTNFALRPTPDAIANSTSWIDRDSKHNGDSSTGVRSKLNDSIKIHAGSRNNTDSAGCTTIQPEDYKKFEAAVKGNGTQERWQYVLTNVVS